MKRTCTALLALLIISVSFAQVSRDPKDIFLDAEYFVLYEEYIDALPGYLQLHENDPDNANINYRIGICYLNIPGQKSKSVVYLEVAVENTTPSYREGNFNEDRAPLDAYFYLGNAYLIQNEFAKAANSYRKYLGFIDPADTVNINYVNKQIAACEIAKEFMEKPVYFEKMILGENVNNERPNFNPLISGDQKSLIYMSGEAFYDAIYQSRKEDDEWGPPENLTPQVQSDGDLYTSALTFNGAELFLSKDDGFNSDLYSSTFSDGVWSTAEKLNKNINTKFWESHAGISPDGKTLYFTSNRKDGYGGLDIYKSERDETTGDWGPAVNLGPVINTEFNEDTPFITEDGKTLYFSSQGHKNMGGFDIFYSTLDDEGNWSTPVNLGFPLNTTDDDLHFVPVNNGTNALYAMYDPESGVGQEDIYWIVIFSDKNPREVEIKGVVRLLNKPEDYDQQVKISLVDKEEDQTITVLNADPDEGSFSWKTKDPGDYQVLFESEGYQSDTKDIQVPYDYSLAEIVIDAELKPLERMLILLRSVFFDFDKYNIKSTEKNKLELLIQVMTENPDLKIEVVGNTDAIGTNAYNQRLSVNRASSVVNYLAAQGISKNRMRITGAGETKPIAINKYDDGSDCPQGRQLNRRVDMHILETENKAIVTEEIIVPEELKIK